MSADSTPFPTAAITLNLACHRHCNIGTNPEAPDRYSRERRRPREMGAIGWVEEVEKALLWVAPHVREGLQQYQGHRSLQNAFAEVMRFRPCVPACRCWSSWGRGIDGHPLCRARPDS